MILYIWLLIGAIRGEDELLPDKFKPIKAYVLGLEEKRKSQLDFVLKMAKGSNSGRMAKMTFTQVMATLANSKVTLAKVDVAPDILAPQENQKRNLRHLEAVSQVYENVALLGDLARRLPHLLVELYAASSMAEKELLKWSFERTQESIINEYDQWRISQATGSKAVSLINLPLYFLAHELDLGDEHDPDYINEFRVMREAPMNETHDEFLERHAEMRREKVKSAKSKERAERAKRGLKPPPIRRRSVEL